MVLRKVGFFQADTCSNLPDELLVNILSRLTLKELLNTRLVSQLFARLGLDDNVWAALFKKYFAVNITGPRCIEKFIMHYRIERLLEIASKQWLLIDFYNYLDRGNGISYYQLIAALKKDFHREYYLLTEFAKADKNDSDAIWTSYLLAKLLIAFTSDFEYSENRRYNLLAQAVRLGNPLAMLEVAKQDCKVVDYFKYVGLAAVVKSALFVIKARNSECLEVIYRLANYYLSKSNLINYRELLLKAAKGGHAQAAYELALKENVEKEEKDTSASLGASLQ